MGIQDRCLLLGMTTIFQSGNKKPGKRQLVQLRLQAKAELWQFLYEIGPDILKWKQSDGKLVAEISAVCSRLMHPHFNSTEIHQEAMSVMAAIRVEHPELYNDDVQQAVLNALLDKLQQLR